MAKVVKKEKVNEKDEVLSFIKILCVILVVLGVFYGISFLLNKKGVFDADYVKAEIGEAVIDYDYLLVGNSLNRSEKSYYVFFDKLNEKNIDVYLNSIVSTYKGKTKLYTANMSLKFNTPYLSDVSNKNVKKVSDFKIKTPTLIKVVNGKVSSYIEGTDAIVKELS